MQFYVYITYSASLDQYYVGQTQNITERLYRHNNSGSNSTKKTNDWQLKYTEVYESRLEAVKRETAIKKMKSRKYIEELIRTAS